MLPAKRRGAKQLIRAAPETRPSGAGASWGAATAPGGAAGWFRGLPARPWAFYFFGEGAMGATYLPPGGEASASSSSSSRGEQGGVLLKGEFHHSGRK